MKTYHLPSGAAIPAIGFGTWQILLNGRAKRAVTEALAAGYRLIDTAMVYGNEKGVGAAVTASGIPREDIFVTTKLWNFDQGYDSAKRAFDMSLSRMGLTYVDLYLIHWPKSDELTRQTWTALEEIHDTALARNIGVSNFDVSDLTDLLSYARVKPAVNQIEFHPFIYADQMPVVEYCREQGIVVEAYSPLARANHLKDETIVAIAAEAKKSPAQILLRWAIQHGTIPLPKSSHKERIRENLDVFTFELTNAQMHRLNRLSTGQSVL